MTTILLSIWLSGFAWWLMTEPKESRASTKRNALYIVGSALWPVVWVVSFVDGLTSGAVTRAVNKVR